jgi:hypothetical protein
MCISSFQPAFPFFFFELCGVLFLWLFIQAGGGMRGRHHPSFLSLALMPLSPLSLSVVVCSAGHACVFSFLVVYKQARKRKEAARQSVMAGELLCITSKQTSEQSSHLNGLSSAAEIRPSVIIEQQRCCALE